MIFFLNMICHYLSNFDLPTKFMWKRRISEAISFYWTKRYLELATMYSTLKFNCGICSLQNSHIILNMVSSSHREAFRETTKYRLITGTYFSISFSQVEQLLTKPVRILPVCCVTQKTKVWSTLCCFVRTWSQCNKNTWLNSIAVW